MNFPETENKILLKFEKYVKENRLDNFSAETLRRLSDGLINGGKFVSSGYMNKEYLSAYTAYYWPVSFTQFCRILDGIAGFKPKSMLDFGCGTGAASAAGAAYGAHSVSLYDRSEKASAEATNILDYIYDGALCIRKIPPSIPGKTFPFSETKEYDLITAGHVLNEIDPEKGASGTMDTVLWLIGLLSRQGRIIIVEPALKRTSESLIMLRDMLLDEKDVFIEAPCVYSGKCPVLKRSSTNTCHGVWDWTPPERIKKSARNMGRTDRDKVKCSYLVLKKGTASAKNKTKGDFSGIVVSDIMTNKSGRARLLVCSEEGRISFSAPRNGSGNAFNKFMNLKKGDRITVYTPQRRETGFGVVDDTTIELNQ
ncbi:MAG: small ribosomal subunit Rsm22 family protein [Fibrobacterota bacterium]